MNKIFCVALVSALLAGCVSAPPTQPQQSKIASSSLGLGAETTLQIGEAWWKAFGDPGLDALIAQAIAGNPDLGAAMARVRAAQSVLASTTASTLPQASFDGNVVRERLSQDYIIPPPYGGTTRWVGTLQANLTYSLDLFGKESDQIDRARATAQAAALDEESARLLLAGSVTQSYIALSRAWALCDVAEEAVRQREGVQKLTAGRVRAGLDTPASQKQAEALLAVAREDLIRAQAVRDITVHGIAALTGRGADAYAIARPKLNAAALALPGNLPVDLLARRADIAAAQASIDAAVSGREFARKAFYPDVNLLALAGTAAIGLGPLVSSEAFQYGGGAAIHLPIFDAGKIRADYAGATAALDEAVAKLRQSRSRRRQGCVGQHHQPPRRGSGRGRAAGGSEGVSRQFRPCDRTLPQRSQPAAKRTRRGGRADRSAPRRCNARRRYGIRPCRPVDGVGRWI
ncbi:MAG: efflux transporter outer membrane subunit [Rhizomicrobium sp.]